MCVNRPFLLLYGEYVIVNNAGHRYNFIIETYTNIVLCPRLMKIRKKELIGHISTDVLLDRKRK